jgi:hypothetical protein
MRFNWAVLYFALLATTGLASQQPAVINPRVPPVPPINQGQPPAQPKQARSPTPLTPKASPHTAELKCERFRTSDSVDRIIPRLESASDDELESLKAAARQCLVAAASQVARLAATDAYDLLGGQQQARLNLAYSDRKQAEHDAELKKQEVDFDQVTKFAAEVEQQNKKLVTQYNELVATYNGLVRDYRSAYNTAQDAVNLAAKVIDIVNSVQPTSISIPTVPVYIQPQAPPPLNCFSTSYDWGYGMSTSYLHCR